MNRYVADGIVGDAESGLRVLYVGDTHVGTREAFNMIQERATLLGAKLSLVVKANGGERIEHESGGRVYFVSSRSRGGRGLAVDVLFIDADLTLEQYHAVLPSVSTSPCGEVIRR